MAEVSTYARSSYSDIIDSALFDVNETEKLYPLPKEELKRWILTAEKDICEKLPVSDKMDLRLIKGQEDYAFADTTGIRATGTVSFSGTIGTGVGTKALTELVNGSNISIGLETRRVVTVTNDLSFTIESAFSNVVATSMFTISPRATEISSEVERIYYIDRILDNQYFSVKIRDIDFLARMRSKYVTTPSNVMSNIPDVAATYTDGGRKFLKIYPPPESDKTITLWTYLRVNPRAHKKELLTDLISLNEMYEVAIAEYLKMRIYSFLKDIKNEIKHKTLYDQEITTLRNSIPNEGRIDMAYS